MKTLMLRGTNDGRSWQTAERAEDWRRDLAVKLALTLAAKFAALLLLWFLFFRGGHS